MTTKPCRRVRRLANRSLQVLGVTLLSGGTALAQEAPPDPYFQSIGAKATATMPRVIIRNMLEDRAGNVWFATFGGPIRYDGETFTNFGEEVGLSGMRVFALTEDRSGALWFGSVVAGASRYDGTSVERFRAGDPSPGARLTDDTVAQLFEDRDGNVWIATRKGVDRYDGTSMTRFTSNDGLVHDEVFGIAQDDAGVLWFATRGGVCSYDGTSFSDLSERVGRSFENVRSLAFDHSGNLWFGGQEGAFRFDGETLTALTTEDGLAQDFVGALMVDRAGNVWMGHPGRFPEFDQGGATRYDGRSFETFGREDGLSVDTVYALLEDSAGNIWFGSAGDGVCRYDGKTFTDLSAAAPQGM